MLDILEQVRRRFIATGDLDTTHFNGIIDFLDVFVDKCHHAKEESLLIPALEAKGANKDGTIYIVLYEHKMGRTHVRAMKRAFMEYRRGKKESSQEIIHGAHQYISLLKEHIKKENNFLFKMADRLLPDQMQDVLFEGFEKIEEEHIGIGRHEEFHKLLDMLRGVYLA